MICALGQVVKWLLKGRFLLNWGIRKIGKIRLEYLENI